MHRPVLLPLLVVLAALVGACGSEPSGDDPVDGAEALAQARTFLDTDRPWSAARLLRRYQEDGGDLDPVARVLAAQAEAAGGDWPRVRTLLGEVDGLDSLDSGLGHYLLARALDDADAAASARAHYDTFLAVADSARWGAEVGAARLRRALVLSRLEPAQGDRALAAVTEVSPDWRAVLQAEALARDGNAGRVQALVGRFTTGTLGRRAWQARIEAAQQSGDLDQARRLADQARTAARTDDARAAFALTAGRLAAEVGDEAAARTSYRQAIDAEPSSPAARQAAALIRQGTPTAADWLALARTDRALGLNSDAADAFRQWLDADVGTPAQQANIRYDAADALFDAQRYDDVQALLDPIMGQTRARELWAGTLGRMGQAEQAAEMYLGLVAADPAPNLYFAADVLSEGGDPDRAVSLFRRIEQEHAGTRWAGLATMRLAGQAFLDGDYADAARLWDGYRGADALRARYWSGRAHAEAGDAEAAESRFQSVARQERDSYYALLASDALGDPFWSIPMSASPPADAAADANVARALRGVDLLQKAGFPDAAEAELDRAISRAATGQADRYALAEALIERGYGRRAILVGQSLGGGTNARRMRILYPFPFRRMIAAEARANGVDPFVAAALIRQESQFSKRATSYVGARGLMQLMPATGRALAQEVEIDDWDPALLYVPEVNVHLGTRYVGQQAQTFDSALPAIFGAYNAGPHQVERWKTFPEYGRDALFTERIPFRETRDYVKILTRNRAIYQGLYGSGPAPSVSGD